MKLISWNINGYRAVTGQNPSVKFGTVTKENKLFPFIEREQPDLICLQEIKADESQIDPEYYAPEGYKAFYNPCTRKKGYSGTALFTKVEPISVGKGFGAERFDVEGRVIWAEFDRFKLFGVYFPKGEAESERLIYKMDFYDEFFKFLEEERKKGKPLIVCGDYNTAHNEIDLARPKENIGTSGFMPEERAKLDRMAEAGWHDTFRLFNDKGGQYSWWSNRGRARENNVGWRLDYFFVTENLLPEVKSAYYYPDQIGSDHCPVVLELAD